MRTATTVNGSCKLNVELSIARVSKCVDAYVNILCTATRRLPVDLNKSQHVSFGLKPDPRLAKRRSHTDHEQRIDILDAL